MTTELLELADLDKELTLDPLTGHDRCDTGGCNAQAFVKVRLYSGSELVFCGHHYGRSEAVLEPLTLALLDNRKAINLKPSVSG